MHGISLIDFAFAEKLKARSCKNLKANASELLRKLELNVGALVRVRETESR